MNGGSSASNVKGLATAGFLTPAAGTSKSTDIGFRQNGAVQPFESSASSSAPSGSGKLAIKISADTVHRVHSASATASEEAGIGDSRQKNDKSEGSKPGSSKLLPEAQVLASLRLD